MKKKFEISERSWRNLRRRALNQTVEISNLKQYIRSYDLPEIVRKVEELKKEMTDFWIKQRNAEKVNELAPEYQETAKYVDVQTRIEEAAQKIPKAPFGPLSGLATEFIKGRFLIIDKNTDQTYVSNKKADMRLSVGFSNALEEKEIKLIR